MVETFIKSGNAGGRGQEHRREGTHFCEGSSYFSFALTEFETTPGCSCVCVRMRKVGDGHVMLKQEMKSVYCQCLDDSRSIGMNAFTEGQVMT